MKKGDLVRIRLDHQELEGKVMLASQNGRSLMLGFDGMLRDSTGRGWAGALPVLDQKGDGQFHTLHGEAVTVEKLVK